MKKIFYIILAIIAFSACETSWLDESKHPMPEGVGAKPEFVFEGESTIEVSKLGGDYTAKIKANQPWLVQSTDSWITVTSDRVGKGDGSQEIVTFTVGKNPGLEAREGKIRMWITNEDEAFITIKQEPLHHGLSLQHSQRLLQQLLTQIRSMWQPVHMCLLTFFLEEHLVETRLSM